MQIERDGGRVVVVDNNQARESFNMALQFALFIIVLAGGVWIAARVFPSLNPLADDLTTVFGLTLAIFALIAVATLLERRLSCEFDAERGLIAYTSDYHFWPLTVRVWRTRQEFPANEVAGLGLQEWSSESGFQYMPIQTVGTRRLKLSLRHGSYLDQNATLDEIRKQMGIAKRDYRREI